MSRKTISNVILHAASILLGVTFVFSGFSKAVDPMGFAYKLLDYMDALGMNALAPLALFASIALSALEMAAGLLMLTAKWRKLSLATIALFMLIFTPLTLYIAIANPVADCGCFGDAFKISNWNTFFKNILLVACVVILWAYKWHLHKPGTPSCGCAKRQGIIVLALAVALSLWVPLYALIHLPIIDFRPYAIGKSIQEGMKIPEGAPTDIFLNTFVYQKEGKEQEFTEENYPWDDSTWTYVRSDSKLLQKGYEPPVKNFLFSRNGADITDSLLNDPNLVLALSVFLNKLSTADVEQLNKLNQASNEAGARMLLATAASPDEVSNLQQQLPNLRIATADERMLKTMIRANPGILTLTNGFVTGKWRLRDLPKTPWQANAIPPVKLSQATNWRHTSVWIALAIVSLAALLLRIPPRKGCATN